MSKAGKKLIAAATEALEIVRGERADFKVTPSCGCIFCDINIPVIKMRRQYIHRVDKGGWKTVVCPIQGIKPMSEGSKSGS